MLSRLALAFSGLLALVLLTSCTYGHKQYQKAEGPLNGPNDFVIQVDDFGQFWDKSEPECALKRIRKLLEKSNVIVVLFVHGWNHNAAPDDEDLRNFAASMSKNLEELSNSCLYREARKQLSNSESISVVSIYVGWRGRSLPGVLNYATFWGRKAAAERVGGGDLREFLVRLNALYRERRDRRVKGEGSAQYFMGMTTIGHSFGGQVLFRAVANEIENQLIAKSAEAGPTAGRTGPISDLIGFGDLVVLVNPALEAMQFERIWRLSNDLDFGPRQNPVMLIVSSAGDIPRQVFFPIGRNLDALLLRPSFREGQRAMWTQALGEYEAFRTHKIDISSGPAPEFDPKTLGENPCAIANLDLTNNIPAVAESEFHLLQTCNHKPNNPFLVAYATTGVVQDHSTIFEKNLRDFLNAYVGIAQAKRMINAQPDLRCP